VQAFQRLDLVPPFPYRRSEYLRRLLWRVIQGFILPLAPFRGDAWRCFWLRRLGARISHRVGVRPGVRVVHPWLLAIGDFSCIGERVKVYNLGPISIGKQTVISQDVTLCAGTHDYRKPDLPLERPPITIGSGVWVCAEAFIGPGVTIGDNAIVAARAVVIHDVPAGMIVAGNPARVVKPREMIRSTATSPAGPEEGGEA
jgi:putative colanic acid biosynthesis acetyltransferase WcaF